MHNNGDKMDMINCRAAGDTYEGVPGMTFEEFTILTKRLAATVKKEDVVFNASSYAGIPAFFFWCFYMMGVWYGRASCKEAKEESFTLNGRAKAFEKQLREKPNLVKRVNEILTIEYTKQ